MNMSMADTTWYVVENTGSERRMPQLARIQFIVHIRAESEFDRFNKAISEKDRYAYRDSYKNYFKRDPHINDTPITVNQFCAII